MLQYKRYIENIWDNFALIKEGGDFRDNEKEEKATGFKS